MDKKSEKILTQVIPAITSSTTFNLVKEKFDSYFNPKKNVIIERYKFNSRTQESGESVDLFGAILAS